MIFLSELIVTHQEQETFFLGLPRCLPVFMAPQSVVCWGELAWALRSHSALLNFAFSDISLVIWNGHSESIYPLKTIANATNKGFIFYYLCLRSIRRCLPAYHHRPTLTLKPSSGCIFGAIMIITNCSIIVLVHQQQQKNNWISTCHLRGSTFINCCLFSLLEYKGRNILPCY